MIEAKRRGRKATKRDRARRSNRTATRRCDQAWQVLPGAERPVRPPSSDGEPVGCGAVQTIAPGIGEIKRVWTSPEARRLGVARQLLRALEEGARERGFSTVRLDTNRALAEARAFYLREGFREIPPYNDEPYSHHWFEKRLA